MKGRITLLAVLLVQSVCALFFIGNMLGEIFGLTPIGWQIFELIEIGAAFGLLLGIGMGGWVLWNSLGRMARAEAQLRVASSAFVEVMHERFDNWGLTPAERDVALFSIKGMSLAEIASLRATSEGTVKAQTNAIYRKAGVSGRPQLLSLFIDDLLANS